MKVASQSKANPDNWSWNNRAGRALGRGIWGVDKKSLPS